MLDHRLAQISLAAAFLAALELGWMVLSGATLDLAGFLLLVAAASAQVLVVTIVISALGATFRRLRRGRVTVPVLFTATSLPLVIWTGRSLFSGRFIRQVPGLVIYQIAFMSILLGVVWFAATLFQSTRIRGHSGIRRLVQASCGANAVVLSYADTHLFVDLYPAFHALLWAGLLYSVCFAADLIVPVDLAFSKWSRSVVLGGLGAALPALALTWTSATASYLVTYSDGTYPKLRELMAAATSERPSEPLLEPPEPDEELPRQLAVRYDLTADPELTQIRSQVRNVVFVLIDTLRADYVGKSVDGASLTPQLDALRKESIYFETAYAPSALTERSMPSLMTSFAMPVVMQASKHGVHFRTWLDTLRTVDYRTFANGICHHTNRAELHLQLSHCFGADTIGTTLYDATHDQLTAEVAEFIRRKSSVPFAVYTHWMEVHTQDAERYVEAVRGADSRIGELVRLLREADVWESTLLIITSDHGAQLGAVGRGGNVCCPETQMRVPALIRIPGSRFTGRTIHTLVSTTEIPGAVVDVLPGRDKMALASPGLVARLYDPDGLQAPHADWVYAALDNRAMIRSGTTKGIIDSQRDTLVIYDVERDPEEKTPLVTPGLTDGMKNLFVQQEQSTAAQVLRLTREAGTEIAADALAATVRSDLSEESMAELLDGFWDRNSPTRRHLLREIIKRRFKRLERLDDLVRDRFEDDDQILLLVRVYADRLGACDELSEHFGSLSTAARLWFGQLLPDLPHDCFRSLSGLVEEQLVATSKTPPEARSDADHAYALTVDGMAKRLGRASSPTLRALLAEAYNRAAAHQIDFETMNGQNFSAGTLLWTCGLVLDPEDPELLWRLDVTGDTASFAARYCIAHQSPSCPQLLARFVEGAANPVSLGGMFSILRRSNHPAMLEEAQSAFQTRFPNRPLP